MVCSMESALLSSAAKLYRNVMLHLAFSNVIRLRYAACMPLSALR